MAKQPLDPVGRAVVRALLRWCRRPTIRDSVFSLPVLDPKLDDLLKRAARTVGASELASEIRPRNAIGVRNAVCAVCRNLHQIDTAALGQGHAGLEEFQDEEPADLGFLALRLLEEFAQTLSERAQRRTQSLDRDGVTFAVGDVVWHKKFEFRGVVVGWDRRPVTDVSSWNGVQQLPSGPEQPFFHIIPDRHDIDRSEPNSRQGGFRYCAQENLERLSAPDDCRIVNGAVGRSLIFEEFVPELARFLPCEQLLYLYPNDWEAGQVAAIKDPAHRATTSQELIDANAKVDAALATAGAWVEKHCAAWGGTLPACFTDLGELVEELQAIQRSGGAEPSPWNADCFVPLTRHNDSGGQGTVSTQQPWRSAFPALHVWIELSRAAEQLSSRRKASLNPPTNASFRVGDVVYHQKFEYRGVIAGWDARAVTDVSQWDGCVDLADPLHTPFYHVVPDEGDADEAFDAFAHGPRYCAQDNLELAPVELSILRGDSLEKFFSSFDPQANQYLPLPKVRFQYPDPERHAELLGAEAWQFESKEFDRAAVWLDELVNALNEFLCTARSGAKGGGSGSTSTVGAALDWDDLHTLLREARSLEDAEAAAGLLRLVNQAHPDHQVRAVLEESGLALARREWSVLEERVREALLLDPSFFEAQNRLVTGYYLQGKPEDALEAAREVLATAPRHPDALSGVALCQHHMSEQGPQDPDFYTSMLDSFERSMAVQPWTAHWLVARSIRQELEAKARETVERFSK